MAKKLSRRSPAEKVSFSLSLFILGIIVGLVCYLWATGDNRPPFLSISTAETRHTENQHYVLFYVNNTGGKTASSVEVVAELAIDGATVETGRQEIDFLSRQEVRRGEFIFSHDPQQGELTVRVASYQEP